MIDATNYILTMMMSSVIDSDVIIVHKNLCAVAIEYDRDIMDTPMVTAKGLGIFADWILVVANLVKTPICQRKKLSFDLYKTVRLYNDIDKRFYQKVALIYAQIISNQDNQNLVSLSNHVL